MAALLRVCVMKLSAVYFCLVVSFVCIEMGRSF